MTTRDAFTAAKTRNKIDLKRYLMNRSSRLLLNLLFWFAKVSLIREAIVVLLRKRAAGCFRSQYTLSGKKKTGIKLTGLNC